MTVTINSLLLPLGTAQLSLNSFHESAKKGDTLQVVHDGAAWTVWASGTTVSERFGARSQLDIDTTAIFADALGRAYSRGIQDAVVRELGMEPQPGKPLQSRLVLQAIEMAETSRKALQGVDFMTQLMFSAAAHSERFVAVCLELGLSPDSVSPPQRAAVDANMRERFAQAAQQGQFPVAPELAQQWLTAELSTSNTQTPGAH